MSDYDLIVIGAGPGGYTAALRAAELGMRTAIVERDQVGGTCLNRGCVPTKALLHASETLASLRDADAWGIHAEGLQVDMGALFAHKDEVVTQLRSGIEGLFKRAKVDVLRGTAQIISQGAIQITDAQGAIQTVSAGDILVATGSAPARPPIPGLDLPGVLTSDDLLDAASPRLGSLVVIGGGVIGAEIATFYADLGTQVTIIEGLDRLLPGLDRELGQNLALILKAKGVAIHTSSMVSSVEESGDGLTVRFKRKDVEASATGEAVLVAVGRTPYHAGLFAPDFAPEMRGRAVQVGDRFETSLPHVYAIGDVSSPVQLAHVAAAQGTACVEGIAGVERGVDLSVVPSCVYCRPEIASVGICEADAKAAGRAVKVGKAVMGGNARTAIASPGRSFMKVVGDVESGTIVGAQLMCVGASDMISQLSVAIANHMSTSDLLHVMRPHPTFEEALEGALIDLWNKL